MANTSEFSFFFVSPTPLSKPSQLPWSKVFHLLLISSNHPTKSAKKHHHFKTDDFPYGTGEKFRTHIFFTRMNTEQVHDIGFPSSVAEMWDHTESSNIGRHFVFAMATDGPRPATGPNMLILSYEVNFFGHFPLFWLHRQLPSGTAWPCREPEVKRPELLTTCGMYVAKWESSVIDLQIWDKIRNRGSVTTFSDFCAFFAEAKYGHCSRKWHADFRPDSLAGCADGFAAYIGRVEQMSLMMHCLLRCPRRVRQQFVSPRLSSSVAAN